jgi:hypothetical protein
MSAAPSARSRRYPPAQKQALLAAVLLTKTF